MLFYIKLHYSEENCVPVNIIFKRHDYSITLYNSEFTTSFYTKKKKKIVSLKKLFFISLFLLISFSNKIRQYLSGYMHKPSPICVYHLSSAWPLQKLQSFQQPLPYFTFCITKKGDRGNEPMILVSRCITTRN